MDDSLAKTARDATGMHGGGLPGSLTTPWSGTGGLYERIGEGHEDYAKSFKKKDG